eukprot:Colp12_sorted_trinity150504_noHs@26475
MSGDHPDTFASPEEEISYWKSLYLETKEEYDEFLTSSRDLEAELEREAQHYENLTKDYKSKLERLEREYEGVKDRFAEQQRQSLAQITSLQQQMTELQKRNEQNAKYIRELEQSNDDYERSERIAETSLKELSDRLNEVIERNALLESEIHEKNTMLIDMHRVQEELRDIRYDMKVQKERRESRASIMSPMRQTSSDKGSNSELHVGSYHSLPDPTRRRNSSIQEDTAMEDAEGVSLLAIARSAYKSSSCIPKVLYRVC